MQNVAYIQGTSKLCSRLASDMKPPATTSTHSTLHCTNFAIQNKHIEAMSKQEQHLNSKTVTIPYRLF